MARFGLYPSRERRGGFWLDVQADMPLWPDQDSPALIRGLNPSFTVQGKRYVMHTHWIVSLPRRELGPPVGNLAHHWDEIARALDMLLTGF